MKYLALTTFLVLSHASNSFASGDRQFSFSEFAAQVAQTLDAPAYSRLSAASNWVLEYILSQNNGNFRRTGLSTPEMFYTILYESLEKAQEMLLQESTVTLSRSAAEVDKGVKDIERLKVGWERNVRIDVTISVRILWKPYATRNSVSLRSII